MADSQKTRKTGALRWTPWLALLLAWALVGCSASPAPKNVASDLAQGDHVTLRFGLTAGPDLEVSGVDVEVDDDADSDGDSDGDSAGVDNENDGIDCQQEGEHEGENEGCGSGASQVPAQMVVGLAQPASAADSAKLLWLTIQLPSGASALPAGPLRFVGTYQGQATFQASEIAATTKATTRVIGVLQDVVQLGGGKLGLRIFDEIIPVNAKLRIHGVSSLSETITADLDGDTEQDGIVCEQEGEHEGENEGC